MSARETAFYDNLAESYHLIFEDWNKSIIRQASVLAPILESYTGKPSPYVLDCACGIGTQTLGLAQRGHILVGSDLSQKTIERAKEESRRRGLSIPFHVADMRDLRSLSESAFDVVLAADNALPHFLLQQELEEAVSQIYTKLQDGGIFVATVRDYDVLIGSRPVVQPPSFYKKASPQRIVHQIWDWEQNEYTVHLYLTVQTANGWVVKHFSSRYRALQRRDLNQALRASGFRDLEWLEPETTNFYQPIIVARKGRV